MLCSVTGAEYVAPDEQQPGTSLFELDLHADYALIEQSLLQVRLYQSLAPRRRCSRCWIR